MRHERLLTSLRALRSRNYRLFFFGQGISLTGYWLTRVASSWLLYRMTHSAFLLGLSGFAGQIPTSFLVAFGGVIADRASKRRVLIVTQVLSMVQPLALTVLAATGRIEVWHIFALSLFQGVVHAIDIPARHALVVEMVEKRTDVANVIALNSSLFNLARMAGPAMAGLLIPFTGEWLCFLLDGLSYLPVIGALLAMKLRPHVKKGNRPVLAELREGFQYVAQNGPIRSLLALVTLVSVWGLSYIILMPVFARELLGGGPGMLGFLMAASGMGALAGAAFLATRPRVADVVRPLFLFMGAGSVALILLAFARDPFTCFGLIFIAGAGFMVQLASTNTLLQTLADDDKRGRVMSFYTLAFLGMSPLGCLMSGSFAEAFGVSFTIALGGVMCLAAAWAFSRKTALLEKAVPAVESRRAAFREIAAGLESAAELTGRED